MSLFKTILSVGLISFLTNANALNADIEKDPCENINGQWQGSSTLSNETVKAIGRSYKDTVQFSFPTNVFLAQSGTCIDGRIQLDEFTGSIIGDDIILRNNTKGYEYIVVSLHKVNNVH